MIYSSLIESIGNLSPSIKKEIEQLLVYHHMQLTQMWLSIYRNLNLYIYSNNLVIARSFLHSLIHSSVCLTVRLNAPKRLDTGC